MMTPNTHPYLQAALFVAALSTVGHAADARSASAEAQRMAQKRHEATSLAVGGNLAGAEAALSEIVVSRPGTTRWRLETAQQLAAVAGASAELGRTIEPKTLAKRALDHLEHVQRDTSEPRLQAAAFALAGNIQERYLGDLAAAQASYRLAIERNPGDRQSAEKLRRLEAAQKKRKG